MPFIWIKITWLAPYYPNEDEKSDPELYARNLQKLYANHLGINISDYSHSDRICCSIATNQNRYNHRTGLIGVEQIRAESGLDRSFIVNNIFKEFIDISQMNMKKADLNKQKTPTIHGDFEHYPLITLNDAVKFYGVDVDSGFSGDIKMNEKLNSRQFCRFYARKLVELRKTKKCSEDRIYNNPFLLGNK